MNKLLVEIEVTRTDGDHFSFEESTLQFWTISLFIVFVVVIGYTVRTYIKEVHADGMKHDTPLLLVIISSAAQLFSFSMTLVHLWTYSQDGSGHMVLDMLSTIFQMTSQLIIAFLLLMIAFGWMTEFDEISEEQLETIFPVGGFTFLIHCMITGFIFLDNDAFHKYHNY